MWRTHAMLIGQHTLFDWMNERMNEWIVYFTS